MTAQDKRPSLFTSPRERRLWVWAFATVVAIWASLGVVGPLAALLRQRNLLTVCFIAGFALVIAAIVAGALRRRPGRYEIWAALGVAATYVMVVVRMGVGPEERTHLFEYGLVGVLLWQALLERRGNGRHVPMPGVVAVIVTGVLGWVDEGIQAILPDRVYDLRDVGFNALAGLMAVVASWALARARRWDTLRRGR